ncbi:MAG: U32 family peptidase [Lachnospiraceae bacterium]|nr:U32 family peptidase [Lachnospiraceae bacterium]
MNVSKKPELLMPAGSLPVLKVAVIYGADAVYIGGEAFSLRANAHNFSLPEMKEGIEFAHAHGVKVYVTANILAHNEDLESARAYFNDLKGIGVDALIISDPGIFELAKEILPEVDIHISTQANNTNYGTYKFWHALGAKRVVSARELSLAEIAQLRKEIPEDMEIETFVHGAMCISYSGRCLLSAYMTGRSANMGDCTHPCRWKYSLMEETRPGEYFPVEENDRGTYIFNSKDLCMIEHLPEMIEAGIDSLKVEGRMKSALYVASVGRTYRMAIDDYFQSPELYRSRVDFYKQEISKCTFREYTTGFFFGKPNDSAQIYTDNTYNKEWVYLGMATTDKKTFEGREYVGLEQKNKFSVGDIVEVMKPGGENLELKALDMRDDEGARIESCPHPKQHFYVDLGQDLDEYDIIRTHALNP